MRIVIEEYKYDIHGYCDDCDYVITYAQKSREFARNIAEMLTDNLLEYPDEKGGQIFVCHA